MVRKGVLVQVVGAALFFSFLTLGQAQAENKYVGADKCKMCHQSESKGNQYAAWKKSKHAGAYTSLASDKAKEIGTKQGIDNPQANEKCLKCHSTGAVAAAASLINDGANVKPEDGVQCESCHGAGEKYWNMTVMKDREKAIAGGLVVPNEALCVKCHNSESPTFVSFDFAQRSKEIAHPMPKKAGE